jgi:hypothetical protein
MKLKITALEQRMEEIVGMMSKPVDEDEMTAEMLNAPTLMEDLLRHYKGALDIYKIYSLQFMDRFGEKHFSQVDNQRMLSEVLNLQRIDETIQKA